MNSVIKENFTSGKVYKALCYAELITRVENIAKEAGYHVAMSYKNDKKNTVKVFLENESLDMIKLIFNYYRYGDYYIYILEVSNAG